MNRCALLLPLWHLVFKHDTDALNPGSHWKQSTEELSICLELEERQKRDWKHSISCPWTKTLEMKRSVFKLWRGRTHWKYSVCIRDKSQGPSSGVPTPQQYINRAEKDVELHHFGHMPVCLLHPPSLMSNSVWSHTSGCWRGFLIMGLGRDISYELWDGLASVTETSFQYAVSHTAIGGISVSFSSPLIFCGGKLSCPWSLHWIWNICSFSFNQILTSWSPTEF